MNLTEQNLSDLDTTTYSVLTCLSAFWGLNGPHQCTVEPLPQIFQKIRMTWYLSLLPCLESALFKHVISHKISRFWYSWYWGTVSSPYRPGEIIMIKVGRRRGIHIRQKRQFSSHPGHQIHVVIQQKRPHALILEQGQRLPENLILGSWEFEAPRSFPSTGKFKWLDIFQVRVVTLLTEHSITCPAADNPISGITQLELLAYVRPWYISQNIYQLPIGHNYDPGPHRQN